MTTIYFIRHSKATKKDLFSHFRSPLGKNMKKHLSKEGVKIAKEKLNNNFNDVEVIYSSNYNRAYETSLILAKRLKLKVNNDVRLGERIHGIKKSYSELPENFEMRQLFEEEFKMFRGESQKEVRTRMLDILNEILNLHHDKVIAVFTHSTALAFLLKEWCNITNEGIYEFNKQIIFNNNWNYCETFKLIFDDNNNIISIENIK